MAKILVTGGAGFIGTNFVRYWRKAHPGDEIVVLDALTYAGRRENLADLEDVRFIHGDIRDQAMVGEVLRDDGIDTLVHFAAESHVDRSISGPDAFIETNIVGTHVLLKAAKQAWLDSGSGRPHRFHHVSTDEVYGTLGSADPAFTETTPYAPNSPYAASKAASDHLVRAYNRTFGLQTTVSNCSNNYGPYQFPEKLIPLFITNALHGKPLPIYGDGQNVRDWLHVDDHCRAIDVILANGVPGDVYNVGGGHETSNLAVIDTICAGVDAAFGCDGELAQRYADAPAARGIPTSSLKRFVPDRLGHDRRYAIDCSQIERELGYRVQAADFAVGFAATLGWYLGSRDWWRSFEAV
jgi:dTDP-glucose 4,6-dehydratase